MDISGEITIFVDYKVMYRKKGYIVARIVGLLAVLLMAFIVAIQTPLIQTRLSKVALNQLAAIMDGRVQYDELKVMTSGVIVIRNLKLVDSQPYTEDINGRGWAPTDTVFRAKTITATFGLSGLFRKEGLHLGRVTIEGGAFHLVSEPGEEYRDNLSRVFHLKPTGEPPSTAPVFDIKKLRVKDFRFQISSFLPDRGTYKGFGVNFDDLDLTTDFTIHKFAIADAKIHGDIDQLSAREKSGYVIEHLSTSCDFGFVNGALFEDLVLRDSWSDIQLRSFALQYETLKDMSDFVNTVGLEGELKRSRIALQTLSYFSGSFVDSPLVAEVRRGHVSGFVRDMSIDRLVFNESWSGVSATVNGHITGLPNIQEALLDAQLQDLTGTTTGFSRFLGGLAPEKPAPDFSQIAHNVPLTLQVTATGPFNDLDLDIETKSPSGAFNLTGSVRNAVDPLRPIDLALNLATHELDLGDILGVDILGTATLRTSVRAVLAQGGLPDATLDSLYIDRIHALGHELHHIRVIGSLNDGTAAGRIQSDDPLLRLDLNGLADLTPRSGRSRYRVDGQIAEANLTAFGVDAGGKLSRVATGLHADLVRIGEYFDGSVRMENLRLMDKEGTHRLGDVQVNARTDETWQEIQFNAPFLEACFQGDRPVTQFPKDLQEITVRRDLSALFTVQHEPAGCGNYTLEALFHDTRELMAIFVPGAYIADNTGLSLSSTDQGRLEGRLGSDRIAFNKNYLRNVNLLFDNREGVFSASVLSSELRAGTLAMLNPAIAFSADDNLLGLGVHYDNFSGTGGEANINLNGRMYRDEQDGELVIQARPVDSYIVAGEETWSFAPADIIYHGKDLQLDHFLISNGAQRLLVDGGFSPRRSDTLSLHMDRFDLALVDEFLTNQIGIDGMMNGKAVVTSGPDKALGMLMDFRIDTLRISGEDAGRLTLSSQWKQEGKELGLSLVDEIDGRDAFRVGGAYSPQEKHLDLQARFDRFPLALASAFLPDIVSEVGGGLSGSLSVTGSPDDPIPYSEDLHIDDATLRLGLTGVAYTVSGPIRVDRNGAYMDRVAILDDAGGSLVVDGALRFEHLKNFMVDSRISLSNLKVLDSPERPGVPFYGLLRTSGSANIHGALSALTVDADISTSGDGNIHIYPTSSTATSRSGADGKKLLVFTEPSRALDPYEEMLANLHKKTVTPADITIHGRLNIQPAVRAYVELDQEAGNGASVSGSGTVSLTVRPSRDIFDLNGDYNIYEGTYQFVLPGLLSKSFTVQRGSSVKFNGDLMNTELDINATYGLRASLDPILGTGNLSRRQVDCMINVGDRLRAPKLNLSIDVPDLDPTTRMAVESALSTSDKIQKQFVSLLLLGTFLPDENSGVFNQSYLLYSNVMEMMSGQINKVLQRLKIPVDVGFGYQEMRTGENLFDISISTELFDNRVVLGGNFGNRRYSTGSAGGDFTGDVDLQVKLDEEGKFRFNVFSHSADEFTSYLDFSQRNGIGISFQKEYKSFADFSRNLFIPKKKRQQLDSLQAEKFAEQVIIHIEQDESGETVSDPNAAR